MTTYAIVLAAGKGTRMKSDLAKVLHRAAGRPLVHWMLGTLGELDVDRTIVVVGHQADAVREILPAGTETALQAEQLGTGHAVMMALEGADLQEGDEVIVVPGDMPLIEASSLRSLVRTHRDHEAAATVLTVVLDDPPPYGRIIRDAHGTVSAIVEARDASEEQLEIREVNTSVYMFDGRALADSLGALRPDNSQGELYLTDVIGVLAGRGRTIAAVAAGDPVEGQGVNTVAELEWVGRQLVARRGLV